MSRAWERTVAQMTGLRFWGMMLLESIRSSDRPANSASLVHQKMMSSARRASVFRLITAMLEDSSM